VGVGVERVFASLFHPFDLLPELDALAATS
jgi:hypothetical protein